MPRKWLERVKPWPALKPATWYTVRVAPVEKSTSPPGVRVQFEFLDAEHAGRTHSALPPLPINPDGLASAFFARSGLDVVVGRALAPRDALGALVRAQLGQGGPAGSYEIARFASPSEPPIPAPPSGPDTTKPR